MQILWWLFGFVCGSIPGSFNAHPISPLLASGPHDTIDETYSSGWFKYGFGSITIAVVVFTILGCLCCKRHHHSEGFQEFKDGNTSSGCDLTFENPVSGLELEVPLASLRLEHICFEPLPLNCAAPQTNSCSTPKTKVPHSAPLTLDQNWSEPADSYNEWFDSSVHIPREKLKYLREIGHGWFGKVVEGWVDLDSTDIVRSITQNKSVIVRILTEEATSQEKSWFLREATPYLKLRHRNLLTLLGSCLETDPYLLLFESCPGGDLKGFLKSNCDRETREALLRGNVLKRMALEVAAGLEHMHAHGIAHTDLAARNCLVASDLSIKLGDYGISIEKYPDDYYIVGHRALPIRWAAPESLKCTDTTIETLEITVQANLWSYGILLWEIVTWGKRPYNNLCDEEVIQAVLSTTDLSTQSELNKQNFELPLKCPEDCPENLHHVMRLCWTTDLNTRPGLDQVRQALEAKDFELRWEGLKPNMQHKQGRSSSLFNLNESIDSVGWTSLHVSESLRSVDKHDKVLSTSFRLGPEEPVKNVPGLGPINTMHDSDSETEEESWLDRVKRGAYTEKVRQKSKSVADLMILVHIDSDSDADWSIGIQGPEQTKKKLTSAGSDSNLKSTVLADEFSEALKKLRNPHQTSLENHSSFNESSISKSFVACDNSDTSNVLTLTTDIEKRPMLRLSSPVTQLHVQSEHGTPSSETLHKTSDYNSFLMSADSHKPNEIPEELEVFPAKSNVNHLTLFPTQSSHFIDPDTVHLEKHILRLVPESNPSPPLLRLASEPNTTPEQSQVMDISQKQKLSNPSVSLLNSLTSNKNESVTENIQIETKSTSNNCDKIFGPCVNIIENRPKEVEKNNVDSENSKLEYSTTVEQVETDSLLVCDSLNSENVYSLSLDPSKINTKDKRMDSTESTEYSECTHEIGQNLVMPADLGVIESSEKILSESAKPLEDSPDIISNISLSEKLPKTVAGEECEEHQNSTSLSDTSSQSFATVVTEQCSPSTAVYRTECERDEIFNSKKLELGESIKGPDVTGGQEDSKRFSTPDDERSSDSGFRDKESCEEEESPAVPTHPIDFSLLTAEEEHLHVISELDAILNAELPGNFIDLDDMGELLSPDSIERKITDLDDPRSDDDTGSIEPKSLNDDEGWFLHPQEKDSLELLHSNSNAHTDVEDNMDDLTLDSQKHQFQNVSKDLQLAKQENLKSSKSKDDTKINTPDDQTVSFDNQSEFSDKIREETQVFLQDLEYPIDEEEIGSTESLHSDNSYISFGLDEEYVTAIRKELTEKLPHSQMPIEEVLEPFDTQDLAEANDINLTDHESWNDEDAQTEQASGSVDIAIRYNVYNTPLSPIMEERETFSIITSDSLTSKNSQVESLASKPSESSNDVSNEDLLLVDIVANKAVLLEGNENPFAEAENDDQDTSNVDVSDDENFDYKIVMSNSIQKPSKQLNVVIGGSAPLPSPEDDLKWQQLSLTFPLPMEEDLMSTSFTSKHDWDSQDEDNSSSSGEFVWKEGERKFPRCPETDSIDQLHSDCGIEELKDESQAEEGHSDDAGEEGEGEEEDVEFTPSAWDATLAPHRSALRSPDKTQRPDQKKSVWFKKQRYHCVYEYPKEASTTNNQEQPITNWKPTSYADWEESMEEPTRLDLYPLEYDETDDNGQEFYVSSSNRPFQFQTGDGEQVSQFFPGATSSMLQQQCQQQLGELRHTRDRLKLNLSLNESQAATTGPTTSPAEERQERLSDKTDLDASEACEAEINSNENTAMDVTTDQENHNEDPPLPLLMLDHQSVT